MKCPNCGSEEFVDKKTDTVHHRKRVCSECGKFIKWVARENKEGRSKASKHSIKDIVYFHGFDEPFCFFCGRTEDQLGESETLTRDHIKELSEGGKNTLKNLRILCTACHKLKNWMNTYIRKHLRKFYENS